MTDSYDQRPWCDDDPDKWPDSGFHHRDVDVTDRRPKLYGPQGQVLVWDREPIGFRCR